ncbi:ras-related protein Rab-27A isoform X5 [Heterocephalus glaber]|uniref:Ras-related protein Rab-27A isoform X5 n=1 Tax=Heterocephalus glaber TaxID=10181 RepID=A0AAX6T3E5_HETGA|nr:ras-related protein Rab-27A isoform X5 [Heterocephalus glaber]
MWGRVGEEETARWEGGAAGWSRVCRQRASAWETEVNTEFLAMSDGDYDYLIKFLALGDSGVGKTSVLYQYTDGVPSQRAGWSPGPGPEDPPAAVGHSRPGEVPQPDHRVLQGCNGLSSALRPDQRAELPERPKLDHVPYFETSAANGTNISPAIEGLLDLIMKRMERCVDKSWVPEGVVRSNGLPFADRPGEERNAGCSC